MTGDPERCQCVLTVCWRKQESFKFAPKNTSVCDDFEMSGQPIPDAGSGDGEGASTKFESGWLLDKVIVADRAARPDHARMH